MTKNISISYFKSPFGDLILGDFDGKICLCDWVYRKQRNQIDIRLQQGLQAQYIQKTTALLERTISSLNAYFSGELTSFDIPIKFVGSDFQQKVWQELLNIPYGKTMSYLHLAQILQNEKAIRAVAAANGANAISIIVPCHRIVGSKGSLIGYAGGLHAKEKLLILEKANIISYKLFD